MSNDISRRSLIKVGGMALVGVWGQNQIPAIAGQQPGAAHSAKTVYLPPAGSSDPVVHSRAENLFWNDMMMEHAGFFATLMPGPELAAQRAQAENFQRTFQNQFDRAKSASLDRANYAAFNRSTVELMKPFIEYKHRMLDAQNAGKIRTLVFSMFFDHTAREAERAAHRLERLSTGDLAPNYSEVVDFWAGIMSDHSELIAHFLDPEEQDLIGQALDSSALFQGIREGNRGRGVPGGEIVIATEELFDFETAVAQGIEAGRIKSILHPTLADHLRRETLKFVDELRRSGNKT